MVDNKVTLVHIYDAVQNLRDEIANNYARKEIVAVIQKDIVDIKGDVKALNNFKFYFVGVAATVGFIVSFAKDFIVSAFKGN